MVKKEFLDNVRSKWIIAISVIFVTLALIVSYFGAAQTVGRTGFQGLTATVTGMVSLETLLVPILGLMLGYGSIVGEREQGSILLLLSMPITRLEAILGKFLGLAAVMMTAILSGLGIAGAVIIGFAGAEGWESYVVFILGSIAFALAFLSIGLLLSTVTRKRSTALGLAVFLWFLFVVIFDTVLFGIYVATGGSFDVLSGQIDLPDWYYAATIVNPPDVFNMFSALAFGITEAFGFSTRFPPFVSLGTTTLSMIMWIAAPFLMAVWLFRRHDL